MKNRSLILGMALSGFCGVALADTATDFVFFDAQIAALQHRIDASATAPGSNAEALTALIGKQQELANQEAKMKAAGTMTPDEKTALGLSIRQQQQRIGALTHADMTPARRVDPASVPAPTYVTPLGTTISGAPGTTPAQTGVVPLGAAPATPAMQIQTPTVQSPTVPVVHAPMPSAQTQ